MSSPWSVCPLVRKVGCEQSMSFQWVFVSRQCLGDGLLCAHASPLSLPRSLAAEETSPKETGLFFLPPSLSFCYISGC